MSLHILTFPHQVTITLPMHDGAANGSAIDGIQQTDVMLQVLPRSRAQRDRPAAQQRQGTAGAGALVSQHRMHQQEGRALSGWLSCGQQGREACRDTLQGGVGWRLIREGDDQGQEGQGLRVRLVG